MVCCLHKQDYIFSFFTVKREARKKFKLKTRKTSTQPRHPKPTRLSPRRFLIRVNYGFFFMLTMRSIHNSIFVERFMRVDERNHEIL